VQNYYILETMFALLRARSTWDSFNVSLVVYYYQLTALECKLNVGPVEVWDTDMSRCKSDTFMKTFMRFNVYEKNFH
jgi:hypothetical protein